MTSFVLRCSMQTDTNGCFVVPCSLGELQVWNLNELISLIFVSSFHMEPQNLLDVLYGLDFNAQFPPYPPRRALVLGRVW